MMRAASRLRCFSAPGARRAPALLWRKLPFAGLQPGYRSFMSSQAFATAAAARPKRPWATASALLFSAFVGFSTSWYVYKYLDGQKNATGSIQGGTNSLTSRYAAVDKMQAVRRTTVDGLLCMCVSHRFFRSNSICRGAGHTGNSAEPRRRER